MMKIIRLIILLILIIIAPSCSAQEKINPDIFVNRVNKNYPEINFDLNNCFYSDNIFICFVSYSSQNNIAVKMMLNDNQIIKKISVSAEKNDRIYDLFYAISDIYAAKENNETIINNLKNSTDSFRYNSGEEHTYSVVVTDDTVYFEIYNNKLNDYIVPQLTLKANDKTEF